MQDAKERETKDLMVKIGDDVSRTMRQTLALTDKHLPVALAGGASAIGIIAGILDALTPDRETYDDGPTEETILLAALLAGRAGVGGDNPIEQAYRDLDALKNAAEPQSSRNSETRKCRACHRERQQREREQ